MKDAKIVTLSDIARRLNTSVNTVSRALRDCSDIGAETKRRVQKTADEMGYQPNRVASFMRSKISNIIAIFISSLHNPFFSICLNYIFNYLKDRDYYPLIIVNKKGGLLVKDIIDCMQRGTGGILTFIDLERDAVEYCDQNNIPLLLCGLQPQDDRVSAIYSHDESCGKLIARECFSKGCRKPCYINGSKGPLNTKRRYGFECELQTKDISCDNYYFDYTNENASLRDIKKEILQNENDFIFCFNDEIAVSVFRLFEFSGEYVGRIYGVDGIAKYLPYLQRINSVGGNLKEVSERCCHVLLNKMKKGHKRIIREIFPVELIRAEGHSEL